MYPEIMIAPMREELTSVGVQELRTAEEVDQDHYHPARHRDGDCEFDLRMRGRPHASRGACSLAKLPRSRTKCFSVFAGQDTEATERARSYFTGYPPSSPSIAILRDGKLLYMMQRSDIERSDPTAIASELKKAFEQFCGTPAL